MLKSVFALVPDAVSVLGPEEMLRPDKHGSNILEVEFKRAHSKININVTQRQKVTLEKEKKNVLIRHH